MLFLLPRLKNIKVFSVCYMKTSMTKKAASKTVYVVLVQTEIKNGGKGSKPASKFMVINLLLAIELKATFNGNPT